MVRPSSWAKIFLGAWIYLWILLASASIFAKMTPLEVISMRAMVAQNTVEIDFNQPVFPPFAKKAISITPQVDGIFEFSDSYRRLTFRSGGFEEGVVYDIKVEGARAVTGAGMAMRKFSFFYELTPPPLVELSPASFPDISGGRVFKASAGDWVAISEPQITEGKYIDIDIKSQLLTLYENGSAQNAYEISSGKYGMPTPVGEFRVLSKEENHWSATYGLWMPYSLRFYGGYFIHELPYWPGGYREGEDHLGQRVSHGCVRLGVGVAEEVYAFADIGTQVLVH